jgi:hypothetical protein
MSSAYIRKLTTRTPITNSKMTPKDSLIKKTSNLTNKNIKKSPLNNIGLNQGICSFLLNSIDPLTFTESVEN